ncbi:MAG: DEAD/DEAH box helicase [Chloroflexota bacterium]
MRFEDLNLFDRVQDAVRDAGYTEPTPIQQQAIPHVLAGHDLIGLAQTGTGKTAAFALPVLHRLNEMNPKGKRFVQVLVIAPTRELASQIHESFTTYGKYTRFQSMTIFCGVSQKPQVKQLNRGVNIVVATPGRLLDLMGQGEIRLNRLDVLILDEADRMFDMGFLPDIRRIVKEIPTERQTLLFSATMPPDIQALAEEILVNPMKVEVAPESTTVEAIDQHVYFVEKGDKRELLTHLINEHNMHRTLVFTRTKRGADRLSKQLDKQNIPSDAIHGNKSNGARNRALDKFKDGKIQVLVATDIVARGIDVDDISHVVNYELPNETESYVHRIGRTGRAGTTGVAVSLVAEDERKYLRDIERLIQMHMDVIENHPYPSALGTPEPTNLEGRRRTGNSNGGGGNNRNRSRNNRRGKGKGSRNRNFKSGGNSNGNRSKNGQRRGKPTPQP